MFPRLTRVGLTLLAIASVMITAAVLAAPRCFPETQQCLDGRLRTYWESNGDLPVFGFPVAPQAPELNRDTNQTVLTQWMEQNRFELHPDNQAPYDVLLGRLGDDRLRQHGVDWQALPRANDHAAGETPAAQSWQNTSSDQYTAACPAVD